MPQDLALHRCKPPPHKSLPAIFPHKPGILRGVVDGLVLATDAVGERTTASLKMNTKVNHLLTQQSEKCEYGHEGFPSTKIQFG